MAEEVNLDRSLSTVERSSEADSFHGSNTNGPDSTALPTQNDNSQLNDLFVNDAIDQYDFIHDDAPVTAAEQDFYALLTVGRDPPPTEAELRSAFHSLSLIFHPDKHNPEQQQQAVRVFRRIQNAYDALADPQKKVVYDLLGESKFEDELRPFGSLARGGAADQALGVRSMSGDEFRDWFIGMMQDRERRELSDMVGSHVGISSNCMATFVLMD
jgi:hypothetical protein